MASEVVSNDRPVRCPALVWNPGWAVQAPAPRGDKTHSPVAIGREMAAIGRRMQRKCGALYRWCRGRQSPRNVRDDV